MNIFIDRQTDRQRHTDKESERKKKREKQRVREGQKRETVRDGQREREIDRQKVIKTTNQLQNARKIRRRSVDVKYHTLQFKNVHAKDNTTAKLTPLIPAPAC